jgi:hypothetical protein
MNNRLYESLPQDPEQAFLILESEFRRECDERLQNTEGSDAARVIYAEYIAQVIAAITELGVEFQFGNRVPKIENVSYHTYLNFSKDVKHYRTKLEIRHGRRVQGFSVSFGVATKMRIKHHIDQLRDIFEKLDVEQNKREALLIRLTELQEEVDRERTRFEAFAALVIETGGVVGDVIEKSKILDLLNGIAKVIWGSKKEENAKRLPPSTPPKRIAPPRPHRPTRKRDEMDDEIPF